MTDIVSPERRSAIMRSVRHKNTSPEILVRQAAHRLGLRFRLHHSSLPGRPDLVMWKWRTVVFVNGCFWHRHTGCKRTTTPKSNIEFWEKKFQDNAARDVANYARLTAMGWRVIVIWQCEARTPELARAAILRHFPHSRDSISNAT